MEKKVKTSTANVEMICNIRFNQFCGFSHCEKANQFVYYDKKTDSILFGRGVSYHLIKHEFKISLVFMHSAIVNGHYLLCNTQCTADKLIYQSLFILFLYFCLCVCLSETALSFLGCFNNFVYILTMAAYWTSVLRTRCQNDTTIKPC